MGFVQIKKSIDLKVFPSKVEVYTQFFPSNLIKHHLQNPHYRCIESNNIITLITEK